MTIDHCYFTTISTSSIIIIIITIIIITITITITTIIIIVVIVNKVDVVVPHMYPEMRAIR